METVFALAALYKHPWIHELPWEYLELLANLAEKVDFKPGEVIFQSGDAPDKFYFISSGQVKLETRLRGTPITVQTLHGGEEIGWSALVQSGMRHFTATAETEVQAIALSGAKLREICEHNPQFGYFIMKHLLLVVSERLDSARLRVLQDV